MIVEDGSIEFRNVIRVLGKLVESFPTDMPEFAVPVIEVALVRNNVGLACTIGAANIWSCHGNGEEILTNRIFSDDVIAVEAPFLEEEAGRVRTNTIREDNFESLCQ